MIPFQFPLKILKHPRLNSIRPILGKDSCFYFLNEFRNTFSEFKYERRCFVYNRANTTRDHLASITLKSGDDVVVLGFNQVLK